MTLANSLDQDYKEFIERLGGVLNNLAVCVA